MRSVGLMAILLLFVACKPVARGPVSELQAVSDGNLTLGMVPVENDEGAQAYRLLVCRKSASYPQWMLEDSNRCRSALLDQEDNEVVFIHSELERDFATKYTDYASGYAAPALIGIGATAAALGGGAFAIKKFSKATPVDGEKAAGFFSRNWDRVKGWKIFDNKVVRATTGAPANIAARTPNYQRVALARYRYLDKQLSGLKKGSKFAKAKSKALGLDEAQLKEALTEQRKILFNGNDLFRLTEEQRALKDLKKAAKKGDEAQQAYIKELNARIDKLQGEDGDRFIQRTLEMDETSLEHVERSDKVAIIRALKRVINDNEKFYSNPRGGEAIQGKIDTLTAKAKRGETPPAGSIQEASRALFNEKVGRKYTPFGISRKALRNITLGGTAAGAAGIAVVTMSDLDKSVWGYGDRQISAHYSQVFSQSMQSENRVKDLPRLLREFADFFGHRVNPAALALGN